MTAFNQSGVKSFRRCQKQYAFRHDYAQEGLELVRRAPKLTLHRGSWMHALQQAHHRQWAGLPDDWEETHEQWTARFNRLFDEEKDELGDLPAECERLFNTYLRRWREDYDTYKVARLHDGSPGVEFVVEVPLEKWGLQSPFKGRIDLLVKDREYGGLWIWDHKWVRGIPDIDERMMSPQALMYAWALRRQGYQIKGFVYNYGRTKPPTIPHPVYGGRQLSTAKKIDTTFDVYVQAIKDLHGDHWKFYAKGMYRDMLIRLKHREQLWFRRERVPVETERIRQALREFIVTARQIERRPNRTVAPRTYLYTCPRHCDYHDLCVAEFQGLDIAPLIRQRYDFVPERYDADAETTDLLVA